MIFLFSSVNMIDEKGNPSYVCPRQLLKKVMNECS